MNKYVRKLSLYSMVLLSMSASLPTIAVAQSETTGQVIVAPEVGDDFQIPEILQVPEARDISELEMAPDPTAGITPALLRGLPLGLDSIESMDEPLVETYVEPITSEVDVSAFEIMPLSNWAGNTTGLLTIPAGTWHTNGWNHTGNINIPAGAHLVVNTQAGRESTILGQITVNGGTLTIQSGTITENASSSGLNLPYADTSRSTVLVQNGTVNMEGGLITGPLRRGVTMMNGTFNMSGGAVSGNLNGVSNTAVNMNGTAILVLGANNRSPQVNISGSARIENNNGAGGTIRITGANASVTMDGGVIANNRNYWTEGNNPTAAVILETNGTSFTMNGGVIEGNFGSGLGAGVHVSTHSTTAQLIIQGESIIRNNNAQYGGGVSVNAGRAYIRGNTQIYNNTGRTNGGGVRTGQTGTQLTIAGGTIFNNNSPLGGGMALFEGSQVTMENGVIRNNRANNGAGIHRQGLGAFTMTGGHIHSNTRNQLDTGYAVVGGGMNLANGTAHILGGTIGGTAGQANAALFGGGIRIGGGGAGGLLVIGGTANIEGNYSNDGNGILAEGTGEVIINGGTIRNNRRPNIATGQGSGISVLNAVNLTVSGGEIYGNEGTVGGGIRRQHTGNLTIDHANAVIRNNDAHNQGGGIHWTSSGTFTMSEGTIRDNQIVGADIYTGSVLTPGGGINATAGVLNITGGNINRNRASIGGGIHLGNNTQLTFSGGNIHGNYAFEGGGIATMNTARLTMNGANARIGDNQAWHGMGVNLRSNQPFDFSDGLIENNEAHSFTSGGNLLVVVGGGIWIGPNATLNMSGGRIANNRARWGGGIGIPNPVNNATVNISGGMIEENRAYQGGGFYRAGGTNTNVHITGGTIRNHTLDGSDTPNMIEHGGGVGVVIGSVRISGAEIYGNAAQMGGGVSGFAGAQVVIDGEEVVVRNNRATWGAGVLMSGSTFTMSNGHIHSNTRNHWDSAPAGIGGGIGTFSNATINLSGGRIESNAALNGGGLGSGLANEHVTVNLSGDIVFEENRANNGGGIYLNGQQNIGLNMSGGAIRNHTNNADNQPNAINAGGGIQLNGPSALAAITGGAIYTNAATHGGGIAVFDETSLTMTDGYIEGNRADYGGGVSVWQNGTMNMAGGEIRGHMLNRAGDAPIHAGGGIHLWVGGDANIAGGLIEENRAGRGGGIWAQNEFGVFGFSNLVLEKNTYVRNNTADEGAGIFLGQRSSLNASGAAILDNAAELRGGGIFSEADETVNLLASTRVDGNSAQYGGGLYITEDADLRVQNSAISNNTAENDGGGIFTEDYEHARRLSGNAFSNVSASNVNFENNRASISFQPPLNYYTSGIVNSNSSIHHHALNNYDVNFRSPLPLPEIEEDGSILPEEDGGQIGEIGEYGVFTAPNLDFGIRTLAPNHTRFDLVNNPNVTFFNGVEDSTNGTLSVGFVSPFVHTTGDVLEGTTLHFNQATIEQTLADSDFTAPSIVAGGASLPTFAGNNAVNASRVTIARDIEFGTFLFGFRGNDIELEVPFQFVETGDDYQATLNWAMSVTP